MAKRNKLTFQQIEEAYTLVNQGMTQEELAARYDISRTQLRHHISKFGHDRQFPPLLEMRSSGLSQFVIYRLLRMGLHSYEAVVQALFSGKLYPGCLRGYGEKSHQDVIRKLVALGYIRDGKRGQYR